MTTEIQRAVLSDFGLGIWSLPTPLNLSVGTRVNLEVGERKLEEVIVEYDEPYITTAAKKTKNKFIANRYHLTFGKDGVHYLQRCLQVRLSERNPKHVGLISIARAEL